ncbi:hypothetical protein RR46_12228 [Papilio xuthus]|uniref:Uncharacterized protein n=1 Tax=Papilio xuthus TaxID=66420 RepID=A0A194PR50_PAPXU|nr:hypothetical protein RR46_12228 [Papilio xuthus]
MDDLTISLIEEVKRNVTRRNYFDDNLDDTEKYRLELLKDTKANKNNASSVIYVKPCENNDPSQPCGTKHNFYKRHVSTPFLCSEKIKNPVIVKEEDRIEEN